MGGCANRRRVLKIKNINMKATTKIVQEATKIAFRDVRAPKFVREGTVVKTNLIVGEKIEIAKDILENKIGQLQYEISLLEHSKEELTGVSLRTEELKYLVKKLTITNIDNRKEMLINFADSINIHDGDRVKIGKLVDVYLKSNNS